MKFFLATVIILIHLAAFTVKADETDLYDFLWLDPDKSVYVLQNKVFKKKKSFYTDLALLKGLTSKYQKTYGFQVAAGHYFSEEWGVEILFNYYENSNNTTYTNVTRINGSEPFIRRLKRSYGVLGVWSPFYGKINTFNKIYYFDWSFALGPTRIEAESNIDSVVEPDIPSYYQDENYLGVMGKTDLRFYIKKNVHLGLELLNTNYWAPGPLNKKKKEWRSNTDALIFIGISF